MVAPFLMALSDPSILELRGVCHSSTHDERRLEQSLEAVDLQVAPGSFVWLIGPSGGGRETAFRLLQLAETPSAGEVSVEGQPQGALALEARAQFRAQRFGFISAAPFFIPTFNAIENIAVPLLKVSRLSLEAAQERIATLLSFAGLVGQEDVPVGELPPAAQWRLALARALANAPVALFVEGLEDALLPEETAELVELFHRACAQYRVAVLILAGQPVFPRPADRQLVFAEGRLTRDTAPARDLVAP